MRRAPAPWATRARAACAVVLFTWAASCGAQLVNHPPGAGSNPFDGEGDFPGNFTAEDYPVEVRFGVISLLGVDEKRSQASVYLYYDLAYSDETSSRALEADYSSCELFCSSRMSRTLNSAGQPTCCDNVSIPLAISINSRGYYTETYSPRWWIYAESDTRIRYLRALQGRFEFWWDHGSFPLDSHNVVVDVLTAFKPILVRKGDSTEGGAFSLLDGYAQEGQSKLRAAEDPATYRPDINSQSLPAWRVSNVHAEVIRLKRKFIQSSHPGLHEYVVKNGAVHPATAPGFHPLPQGQWRGGQFATYAVRLYIKVQRRSTGFWVMTCILPVALVTIFGFGVQSLPRQSLKARSELLSTLFLSLVLLQTVLYQFLPPLFFLTLPLMLVLVGYMYTLMLFMVIVVAHALEDQWRRRQLKVQRRWASQVFSMWADRLQLGPGAQEALSQSAASSAVPFDVTREQVMNPLQGSRAKQKKASEGQESQAAASDASNELTWIVKHRSSWWFRVPPIRLVVEWWKFTGRESSQEYCRLVANRFDHDQGARLVLLLTYVAVVVALCLAASAQKEGRANAPSFPA